MKLANDTITIFNACIDDDGGHSWSPTVVNGVSWYATDEVSIDTSKGGLVAAGKVTVRIPVESGEAAGTYVTPLAYGEAASLTGLWTLAEGDLIVRGTMPEPEVVPGQTETEPSDSEEDELEPSDSEQDDLEPSDSEEEEPPQADPAQPKLTQAKIREMFADCITILSVTDNRRAPNAPHWRVTGS